MDQVPQDFSPSRGKPDVAFYSALLGFAALYLLLIIGMLAADIWYACTHVEPERLIEILTNPDILASIRLTLFTCTISSLLSVFFAIPIGYLFSRYHFPGKALVESILDIPIILPPLVVGISLLILFNQLPPWNGPSFEEMLGRQITYNVPAIILAQLVVSCAFAIRTMRNTFDQISPRTEQVALTLGCNRSQAFLKVLLPEAWRGISTSGTLAWTKAMGEFGPILVFAGAIRGKTEVLPTTIFLEFSTGNLEGAVIVSLLMVTIAITVLIAVRIWDKGTGEKFHHD